MRQEKSSIEFDLRCKGSYITEQKCGEFFGFLLPVIALEAHITVWVGNKLLH